MRRECPNRIADWLAKGPYHDWRLQSYKCIMGKYVPKNEV